MAFLQLYTETKQGEELLVRNGFHGYMKHDLCHHTIILAPDSAKLMKRDQLQKKRFEIVNFELQPRSSMQKDHETPNVPAFTVRHS